MSAGVWIRGFEILITVKSFNFLLEHTNEILYSIGSVYFFGLGEVAVMIVGFLAKYLHKRAT
jgi:hypothetical protein